MIINLYLFLYFFFFSIFLAFRELNFGGDDKDQSSNVTPGTGYR